MKKVLLPWYRWRRWKSRGGKLPGLELLIGLVVLLVKVEKVIVLASSFGDLYCLTVPSIITSRVWKA